jgi:hypothetical protein
MRAEHSPMPVMPRSQWIVLRRLLRSRLHFVQRVFRRFVMFSGGPARLAQVPPGITILVALGIQYL